MSSRTAVPSAMPLTNTINADGTLRFAAFRATVAPETLARHLAQLPGAQITRTILTAPDVWIAFTWEGRQFDVNEQFGEFWFVARDALTPEALLVRIASHAMSILRENPEEIRRESRREAWSGALGGLAAFTVASLSPGVSQSPLLRILAFVVGTITGAVIAGQRWMPAVRNGSN